MLVTASIMFVAAASFFCVCVSCYSSAPSLILLSWHCCRLVAFGLEAKTWENKNMLIMAYLLGLQESKSPELWELWKLCTLQGNLKEFQQKFQQYLLSFLRPVILFELDSWRHHHCLTHSQSTLSNSPRYCNTLIWYIMMFLRFCVHMQCINAYGE